MITSEQIDLSPVMEDVQFKNIVVKIQLPDDAFKLIEAYNEAKKHKRPVDADGYLALNNQDVRMSEITIDSTYPKGMSDYATLIETNRIIIWELEFTNDGEYADCTLDDVNFFDQANIPMVLIGLPTKTFNNTLFAVSVLSDAFPSEAPLFLPYQIKLTIAFKSIESDPLMKIRFDPMIQTRPTPSF